MTNLTSLFRARSKLKRAIREFFDARQFLEVDTPILVSCPGTELYLGYFQTHWVDHYRKTHPLWLRSSPELALKRALVAGIPALYQIAPCFRNEGELGPWHHPEFTMLEFYQVGVTWEAFLKLTEDLIRFCIQQMATEFPSALLATATLHHISVRQAFKDFVGVDLIDNDASLAAKAKAFGVQSINGGEDFATAFFKILLDRIEPALTRMGWVVLYDYPPSQAALARVEGGVAKRFEFYIQGVELSNGFNELCDPMENRRRVKEVHTARALMAKDIPLEDEAFYAALDQGLPDCFGNALGVDRLLALILGSQNLESVIPFRKDRPFAS